MHKVPCLTQLSFVYRLNGPKILNWKKQCNDQYCDHLDFGFNLTPELHGSSFIVKVTAINMLGNSSLASMFTFLDIGRSYFTFYGCCLLAHENYFLDDSNPNCFKDRGGCK